MSVYLSLLLEPCSSCSVLVCAIVFISRVIFEPIKYVCMYVCTCVYYLNKIYHCLEIDGPDLVVGQVEMGERVGECAWNNVDEAIATDIELFQSVTEATERSFVQTVQSIVRQIKQSQSANTRERTCTRSYSMHGATFSLHV